jgi:hypothetical protein
VTIQSIVQVQDIRRLQNYGKKRTICKSKKEKIDMGYLQLSTSGLIACPKIRACRVACRACRGACRACSTIFTCMWTRACRVACK